MDFTQIVMTFKEIYSLAYSTLQTISNPDLKDFRLEEAEFNQSGGNWVIVISYLLPNINIPDNPAFFGKNEYLPFERVYKKLIFDEKGQFKGMFIYDEE